MKRIILAAILLFTLIFPHEVSAQTARRTDSFTGDDSFSVNFVRTLETPVSLEFDVVIKSTTDKTNLPLDFSIESLNTGGAAISPKAITINELTTVTTYRDEPIYEYSNESYKSIFGIYRLNEPWEIIPHFYDLDKDGKTVLFDHLYTEFDEKTLTWSWIDARQTGTRQIPVRTEFSTPYFNKTPETRDTASLSIASTQDKGYGAGFKKFHVIVNTGLLSTSSGWGSSGVMVWLINGVKYFDTVHSSWWDTNWLNRKSITINHTDDGAQTNYQMKMTVYKTTGTDDATHVYLGSNVQDDFDDVRWTTATATPSALDFWQESYTSGTSAVDWVEFDSIPAHPDNGSFYLYYNYTSATAASNGDNTFIFFDDFNDGSLDATKWTVIAGSQTEAGGVLTSGPTDDKLRGNTAVAYKAARIRGKATSNVASAGLSGLWGDANNYNLIWRSAAGDRFDGNTYNGVYHNQQIFAPADTNYHIFEVRRISSSSTKFYVDASTITMTANISTANMYAWIEYITAVDWFLIRNLTANEPTWGTWGAEENVGWTNIKGFSIPYILETAFSKAMLVAHDSINKIMGIAVNK